MWMAEFRWNSGRLPLINIEEPHVRTLFDVTAILTVTVLSIQMGLILNWALLTAMFKAMNLSKPVKDGREPK
jgi:hypothetical protein